MLSTQALSLLEQHKYFVLFPLAVLEGPLVTIIAGWLVGLNVLDAGAAYLTVVLGDVVGDSFWYAVGRFGRGRTAAFVERLFGLTPARLERTRHTVERRSLRLMVLAKLSHGVGVAGLAAAGAIGMSATRFLAAALVVALVQSGLFLALGMFFGHAYETIGNTLNYIAAGTVVAGASAVALLAWHRLRMTWRAK